MPDQDKTKAPLLAEIVTLKESLIDQQHQIEQLRQSEKKYLNLFRDSAVGMAVVMSDGRFIQANKAFCDFLGYSEQELCNKTVLSLTHPDDREATSQAIHQTFTSGPRIQRFDKRYFHKSGRVVWGEVTNTLISDVEGTPSYAIAQVLDINERKQVHEALLEREAQLLEAQEVACLGFYVLDLATGRWTSSSVLDRIFGIPGEYERTIDGWENLIHPDERQKMLDYFLKDVIGEKKPCDREYRIVRYGDKQVRWVHGLGRWRFNENGQPICMLGTIQDITERRQAEEALRASEAKYRRLHQSMMDAFVDVNMDGFIQECNEAYRQMLGYEPEEICKLRYTDITPEKWHSFQAEIIEKQVLTRGYSEIYEKEYQKKDGTIFPVELRTFLIKDENGRPIAMWAIVRDITERKRAEQALQRARDELECRVEMRTTELVKANKNLAIFRKFAEASGEGFGMSDFEGRIAYVNPTLCRLCGEKMPKDMIGNNIATYYPKEYMQRRKNEMIPALLRKGYWQAEQALLPRRGKPIQTLQGTFLIRDESGDPFRIAVVISDITELKQVENALRKSNDELQAIYDGMVDGLLIADVETKRFVQANAAICQMLGYSMNELLSKSVMDIHPANDLTTMLKTFQAQAAGQITINENAPVLRKDGSVFYADIATNRIAWDHRFYLIGFFRDITERTQAQEALQKEHRTLKHLLQSSDHERQTIAYEIHDGLAQYLAGAIMQFEVYRYLMDSKPNEATKAYEGAMTLLHQSHFEARRLIAGVRPPVLDEAGVVEAIAHLINEHNLEKGPQIEFRSQVKFSRLVPILENAIYRICQESLANACQHSQSEKVRVSLVQWNDRIQIDIQDWGLGFNPKKVKGDCYGLAGIRERARLLNGKCRIQSELGKGTRIKVELPLMEREE